MLRILIAFTLKALDNALSTCKTIYLQKEKFFIGGIFNALSTFFYLLGVVQLTKDNSLYSIISMCIATFLGTYIPGIIIKKSERDKLYIFEITAPLNEGKTFADEIRELNLPVKTSIEYNTKMEKVLSCKIYCNSKQESKIVEDNLPIDFKYHIYVPIEN
jgi:hypothetical protein